MAKRPRWAVLLSLVVAVAVLGTAIAVLGGRNEPGTSTPTPDGLAPADTRDAANGDPGSATASDGTLTTTGEPAAVNSTRKRPAAVANTPAPTVSDIPAPPASDPPAEGELPNSEWEQYVAETREIVEANQPDLAATAARVTQALSEGDKTALASLLAPDEGTQNSYVAALAERYPPIIESAPADAVNIFSADAATVYFAYAVVRWSDGGLVSEHTIPITLRFVDDEWRLTTLGDAGSNLEFVQSVQL